MKLRFKSIRTKLLCGFGALVVIMILNGVLTYLEIDKLNGKTDSIVNQQLPLLTANENLVNNMSRSSNLIRDYVLYHDPTAVKHLEKNIKDSEKYTEKILALTNDKKHFNEILQEKATWENMLLDIVKDSKQNKESSASAALSAEKTLSDKILQQINELTAEKESQIKTASDSVTKLGVNTIRFSMIVLAVILILSIVISILLTRSLTGPIKSLKKRMNEIAQGDLSKEPLVATTRDELGDLTESLNTMSNNNRNLLKEIQSVSETVSAHSEELTQSASEVKAGTEQVAVTMEELATGAETQANHAGDLAERMMGFAGIVTSSNENGKQIGYDSNEILEMTESGSVLMNASTEQMKKIHQIVQDAVEKMQKLDNNSKEISKLVAVIKEIADQTNLLALNAAIEAARAGEHGKGFAVVADEVRKLAEQVTFSVTDITGIVGNIQKESTQVASSLHNGYQEVEKGTVQIQETADTLENIKGIASKMARNIATVSENLAEITSSSEKMNSSIEEIASVSEESAAGVEQTAASAQQTGSSMEEVAAGSLQLAQLAEQLNAKLQQYKI